jgi:hypothetical protein
MIEGYILVICSTGMAVQCEDYFHIICSMNMNKNETATWYPL